MEVTYEETGSLQGKFNVYKNKSMHNCCENVWSLCVDFRKIAYDGLSDIDYVFRYFKLCMERFTVHA